MNQPKHNGTKKEKSNEEREGRERDEETVERRNRRDRRRKRNNTYLNFSFVLQRTESRRKSG